MIRMVAVNLLLFLLPFILFALYAWLSRRSQRTGNGWLDNAPIITLSLAGIALVITMMTFFISFEGLEPGGQYVPPRFEDGVVQPGYVERDTDQ